MPEDIRKILKKFKQRLKRLYGERLTAMYLFGSYARGDNEDGSDLDILVVLNTFRFHSSEISRTADLVSDLSLDYLITVSPMFIRERDWRLGKKPLLRNVKNEGIKLYKEETSLLLFRAGEAIESADLLLKGGALIIPTYEVKP
ncbi:MAG: nucleotidyltransferase domain-containing protein [Chloroflexi bacterium]|nr:nucleotidyltransferase domain-containing protein [Chloroflexota bacterium]